jgi:hypothetical protein
MRHLHKSNMNAVLANGIFASWQAYVCAPSFRPVQDSTITLEGAGTM